MTLATNWNCIKEYSERKLFNSGCNVHQTSVVFGGTPGSVLQTGKPPRWNFHKYLLDRTGQPVAVFESAVEPEDRRVTSQVEKLLAAR